MSKLRQYKKVVEKTLKDSQKGKKSKAVKSDVKSIRVPSGITMPTQLPPDLCDFLEKPKNTLMARTQVTKEIYAYIKENKLQDDNNKKKINPDRRLKNLLGLNDNEELTFFNLQSYLSPQFSKNNSSTVQNISV
jgi:chromatin remodeling complex protein RSC6